MQHAISSRERKLDSFFLRASAKDISEEIQSDLAKFGAILVCGYVERCVETIILERLSNRAHPRITKFIQSFFKAGRNYDCEAICQLLERFDDTWSKSFRRFLSENDQLVTAISSAYAIRNPIAHGGDANRGLAGVKELYNASKATIVGLMESTQ